MSERLQGFAFGIVASTFVAATVLLVDFYRKREIGTLSNDADDECLSLFYGKEPGPEGSGFPFRADIHAVDTSTMTLLTTVHPEYRRLPKEFYGAAVEMLPIVCVDVILCRPRRSAYGTDSTDEKEVLLFYRRDAPAKGIWWWPGGRMFRGETFFTTALRKIRDETGQQDADITPIAVLQVWNTFFPDSSWDAQRQAGREGTHTVNIVVFCELRSDLRDENGSTVAHGAREQWAVEAHKWVSVREALEPGRYDKYVTLNIEAAIKRGLLSPPL